MPRNGQQKTIPEINERLRKGEAVVMTAMEFKREVRNGRRFRVRDVDVVTTATRGTMSGTSAMLVVPLSERAAGSRIERIWLNGVPCIPGTAPADEAGRAEIVVYGTAESRDFRGNYGGGHLLRNIVEGCTIEAEAVTEQGRAVNTSFTAGDLGFARLYSFRNAFQNYNAFANIKNHRSYRENRRSIFACRPLPALKGMSFAGCGELNPLENDPHGRVFRAGMKILVNKAPGIIVGYGTRSSPQRRNLSVTADMSGMDPEFMGGFRTSSGVEIINSIAVPVPVIDREVLNDLSRALDENIPLFISDIGDRLPLGNITYGDVWSGAALEVEFDPDRCISCSFICQAEYYCPMQAISWKDKTIDRRLCFSCGACISNCLGGAFHGKGEAPMGNMGMIRAFDTEIPVLFRQSNRHRAEVLATYLKDLMLGRGFFLNDSESNLRHWHT